MDSVRWAWLGPIVIIRLADFNCSCNEAIFIVEVVFLVPLKVAKATPELHLGTIPGRIGSGGLGLVQ